MNDIEFTDLLNRYREGKCSPEEVVSVDNWYIYLLKTSSFEIESVPFLAIKQWIWNEINPDS